jgi:cytochrome c-type biogenesis protein CcmE
LFNFPPIHLFVQKNVERKRIVVVDSENKSNFEIQTKFKSKIVHAIQILFNSNFKKRKTKEKRFLVFKSKICFNSDWNFSHVSGFFQFYKKKSKIFQRLRQSNRSNFSENFLTNQVLENIELYPPNRRFKLGGLVKVGSIKHNPNSFLTTFVLTDLSNEIQVSYKGVLPDMFNEGSGGVCEGFMTGPNDMKAVLCLAKHDQRYLPLDLAQVVARNKKELVKKQAEDLKENSEIENFSPSFTRKK